METDEKDSGPRCPNCGGTQFEVERLLKGKLAPGALATKTQVKCVTCGTVYKRG